MLKAYSLRFHRWITLLFALPLLVVIATGLILSFEPLAQQSKLGKPLTSADMLGYLKAHDPDNKATGISIRTYEHSLTINGVGEDGETEIDLMNGEVMEEATGWAWSDVFRTSRRLHETLLLDLGWVVTASTWAMLALAALGLLMGWPRIRNTVGGWHIAGAWFTLPLVILSPLTGLALVYGITLTPASNLPRDRVPIAKAVEMIGEKHDLAKLTSLRTRGGRLVARIHTDSGIVGYAVTANGIVETPRNWPRAIHEGNWSPTLAPVLNILVSVVFVGLLFTGLFIWLRRKLRQWRIRAEKRLAVQPAE